MPLPPAVKLDLKFEQLLPLVLDPLSKPLHRAASSLRNMAVGSRAGPCCHAALSQPPQFENRASIERIQEYEGRRLWMRVEGGGRRVEGGGSKV